MKRWSAWMIVAALGCLAAGSSAAAEDSCGAKGQKPCPLQGWMEDNVQVPLEKGDMKAVAKALKKAAKLAPEKSWNEGDKAWEKFAAAGVEAAGKGDKKALKASCKGCHKAWRKEYRKKFRTRPVK